MGNLNWRRDYCSVLWTSENLLSLNILVLLIFYTPIYWFRTQMWFFSDNVEKETSEEKSR